MKIKNHRDFWAGLLFVCIGLMFAVAAADEPLGSFHEPAQAFFPLLLGLLAMLLGCLLFFKALTFETEDGAPVGAVGWNAMFVVAGAIGVGGLLLPVLGLLASSALLVWLLGNAAPPMPLKRWLLLTLVTLGMVWLVLGGLPMGLLPVSVG